MKTSQAVTRWDHRLFQVSVVFKGIDGVLELVGGVLLLVFGPNRVNRLIQNITQNDLAASPHNFLSHILSAHLHVISSGSVHFAAFYLLFQGVVKVWLAEALLRERRWVFPVALALMGAFEIYMIIRFTTHPGWGLAFLFALNLFIIFFIWREYRHVREGAPNRQQPRATAA